MPSQCCGSYETTRNEQTGFVGGMKSAVVDTFEAGFVRVPGQLTLLFKLNVQYVGDFADAE